jgi:hypothetical protein
MNPKNHCDDFGQKRRFCYVDIAKMVFFTRISSIFIKVRVNRNGYILNLYQQNIP